MSAAARISYLFVAVILLLVGWLHLSTLLLTVLFGYFALQRLSFGRSKALGVTLFLIDRIAVSIIFRTCFLLQP